MTAIKTKRQYMDVETNEYFDLYSDSNTHEFSLISNGSKRHAKGTEVNGFYICSHTSCTIKINAKKQIYLPQGTFYNLKEGEKVTHRKFICFSRFTKV